LVGEGGGQRLPAPADPIRAWIDLMEVVRMLRPHGAPAAATRPDGESGGRCPFALRKARTAHEPFATPAVESLDHRA